MPAEPQGTDLLLQHAAVQPLPPPAAPSSATRLHAAGLYLDIVKFSTAMDRLESDRGMDGLEDLIDRLNACFQPVTDAIAAHGGEVASVIGDGLIAAWPCAPGAQAPALAAAVTCARAILAGGGACGLAVRIAVGVGDMFATSRNTGLRGRMLVAGPLVAALSAACGGVAPDELMIVPPLPTLVDPTPAAVLPVGTGAGDHGWLAALRVATVAFVRLRNLDPTDWDDFARASHAAGTLDQLAQTQGGVLEKVQAEDKGFTALVTFGLPPRLGTYRPEQALPAAIAMHRALLAQRIEPEIGIATGGVFRGTVGLASRVDFTTHGNAVHRAVRLMAQAGGRILCDAPTCADADAGWRLQALPPLRLKGFAEPVTAYALPAMPPQAPSRAPIPRAPLVGRARETGRLLARLAAPLGNAGSATAVLAPAGLGKTALLHDLAATARAQGARVLAGAGQPLASAMPYWAWQSVFLDIFGLRADDPATAKRARILAQLADDPAALALAPLLDAVAPLGLPENDTTRGMSERARAAARGEMLIRLILRHAQDRKLLIIFDDGHWLDDASARLLADPALSAGGVDVVVGCRPHEGASALLQTLLGERPGFETISLGALGLADSARLMAAALGTQRIADDAAGWIWRATAGHPLFTVELARLLRDRGLLVSDSACAELGVDAATIDALPLPGTVAGVVTDRLDRLGRAEQIAFRAASVIGVTFDLPTLEAIFPDAAARPLLPAAIARLVREGLFAAGAGAAETGGEAALAFAHPTFRTIGYQQAPREEKRALHRAVARALEPRAATDPRSTWAVLGFHYRLGCLYPEALRCYEHASALALSDGEYSAALDLTRQAQTIYPMAPALGGQGVLPACECRARQARSHLALGQLDAAFGAAVAALRDVGHRWPHSGPGCLLGLARAVLAELAGAIRTPPVADTGLLARLSAGVDAATCLMFIGYYRGRPGHWALACLWAVRFAARSRDVIPATHSYGALVVMAGLLRLGALRRYLWRRQTINARHGGRQALRVQAVAGWLHHAHFCEWEAAEQSLRASPAIAAGLDDPHQRNNEIAVEAFIQYLRGDLTRSAATYASIRPRAEKQRNGQNLLWSRAGQAFCLLAAGRAAAAIPELLAARALLGTQTTSMDDLVCDGPLAVAYLRTGDLAAAEAVGAALLPRVCAVTPNAFAALEGYAGAVEVWLGLAEAQPDAARRHLARARRAIRRLRLFAMIFPVGRPRYWYYRGFLRRHAGAPQAARSCWRRAADAALRNRMPLEAARAAAALAAATPAILPETPAGAGAGARAGRAGAGP